ncbi:hypothetical protein JKP88DRAFT_251888 [Tribonema minus]|uniref:Uncharacterized protein n=1 Tax=Tribonema minus TaxID=303371 RepID=A0A835ZGM7_9STRA|nr:hypothetical protein JKP88DRAFT_251888 [Tribonema minus]
MPRTKSNLPTQSCWVGMDTAAWCLHGSSSSKAQQRTEASRQAVVALSAHCKLRARALLQALTQRCQQCGISHRSCLADPVREPQAVHHMCCLMIVSQQRRKTREQATYKHVQSALRFCVATRRITSKPADMFGKRGDCQEYARRTLQTHTQMAETPAARASVSAPRPKRDPSAARKTQGGVCPPLPQFFFTGGSPSRRAAHTRAHAHGGADSSGHRQQRQRPRDAWSRVAHCCCWCFARPRPTAMSRPRASSVAFCRVLPATSALGRVRPRLAGHERARLCAHLARPHDEGVLIVDALARADVELLGVGGLRSVAREHS